MKQTITEALAYRSIRALLAIVLVISCGQAAYAVASDDSQQSPEPTDLSDKPVNELKLSFENWDQARHGERLLTIPELKTLVNQWSSVNGHSIELRYPGGEEGELWVRELMDWLISLGIPSQYLVAVPGSGEADVIKFQIIKTGEMYR